MTTSIGPICLYCQCFHQRGDLRSAPPGLTCDAFPQGIPEAILGTQVDHRRPYAGDGGLRFVPQDEEAQAHALDLLRMVGLA